VSDEDEDLASVRPSPDGALVADNSVARLLTLSDGVFAIAMTLLALDIKVPDVVKHPTDAQLRQGLADNSGAYWAFLVSFLVVASYWGRHRRLMQSVETTHPALIRDTLFLLLLIAVMPFPASLISNYGSVPFTLVVYGGVNVLASIALMVLSRDVRRLNVHEDATLDSTHKVTSWMNLIIFVLVIPSGYVLGHHGPWALLLLAVPRFVERADRLRQRLRRRRAVPQATPSA
jgi:uncharacterized membrane protein